MIRSLRRKVVAIVMSLVGLVLAAMLTYSYVSSYTTQWQLVDDSLARGLEGDGFMPVIGGMPPGDELDDMLDDLLGGRDSPDDDDAPAPDFRGMGGGRLVARVMLTWDGTVIGMGDAATVDEDVLNAVVEDVSSSEESSGRLPEVHVAWRSGSLYGAGTIIAIADTSDVDEALRQQLVTSLIAFFGGLAALLAIAWPLSSYVLRPAERAWEQQRRFVADASHELKTPLAVIVANMGILERDEALPEGSRRWVESSVQAAGQMQGLVTELLELARTDETVAGDAGAMASEDVDLSDVVESAALEFNAVAFERGCTIEAEVAGGVRLTGDAEWLRRLAKILVDNAVKYARAGSAVRVSLVEGTGRGAGSRATLAVTNEGEPIPAEDLSHVFDRFYRSDAARSRSTGGFGLGLAIAKGIAEAHGGTISATSDAEAGTTFTVRL